MKLFFLKKVSPGIYLSQIKKDQKKVFDSLKNQLPSLYRKLKEYDINKYTMPIWNDYKIKLEKLFLPNPPFDFLRHPIVKHTMFVEAGGRWLKEQIIFLEAKTARDDLCYLLQEDYVGNPRLLNSTYLTSHNSIHHLYHLFRFEEITGRKLDSMNSIIEWGGGYGNMAKILHRRKKDSYTYVIIDIPLFSCLQWLYLSVTLGQQKVHLLAEPGDALQPGKINLMPLCFLEHHDFAGDLFISTWGLNESSRYSQDYVIQRHWFQAKHLLLGYQDSDSMLPDSDRIGKLAETSGAVIEDINFLPQHHYAFR